MKKPYLLWSVIVVVALLACASWAGLEGERYAGAYVMVTELEDDNWDTIITVGADLNLPVADRIDAFVGVWYSEDEGEYEEDSTTVEEEGEAVELSLGLDIYLLPEGRVVPFLEGVVLLVKEDRESTSEGPEGREVTDNDEENVGFSAGVGVDIELGESSCLTLTAGYTKVEDYDDWRAGAELEFWFTDTLGASILGEYGFDEEDKTGGASLKIAF